MREDKLLSIMDDFFLQYLTYEEMLNLQLAFGSNLDIPRIVDFFIQERKPFLKGFSQLMHNLSN